MPRKIVFVPDWVSCGQVGHGDIAGGFVGDQGVLGGLLAVVGGGELGQISVIVALHLVVKDLGLAGVGAGDEVFVENVQDVVTDVFKLLFHLFPVGPEKTRGLLF